MYRAWNSTVSVWAKSEAFQSSIRAYTNISGFYSFVSTPQSLSQISFSSKLKLISIYNYVFFSTIKAAQFINILKTLIFMRVLSIPIYLISQEWRRPKLTVPGPGESYWAPLYADNERSTGRPRQSTQSRALEEGDVWVPERLQPKLRTPRRLTMLRGRHTSVQAFVGLL